MAIRSDAVGVGSPAGMTALPRRKGRPANADQKVGRETILEATRLLLLRLPPSRVTIAAVARAAGVDPALIRYYFKNRMSLLRDVAEAVVMRSTVERGLDPALSASVQLRTFAEEFFDFVAANPFMHRLMLDELAHAAAPEHRAIVATLNLQVCLYLGAVLAHGAATGEFRRAEPLLVYLTLVGMCEFFGAAGPIVEGVLGPQVDPDAFRAQYLRFMSALLVDGLRPLP